MKSTHRSSFETRLSPHFQLGEFALWSEQRRFTQQHQLVTALELCAYLEKLRSRFAGRPVKITSGYRPPDVNRAVGGATSSEHLFRVPAEGAVDVVVVGAPMREVETWVRATWPYSVGMGAHLGFVHVGKRADHKRRTWSY